MIVDLRDCPRHKSFAEHISEKIGLYVRVANFTQNDNADVFRIITDAELFKEQLESLMALEVEAAHKTYRFVWLETLSAPVVDTVKHCQPVTSYIRATFM